MMHRALLCASATLAAFALAGCASAPPAPTRIDSPPGAAERAAGHALKMVGRPYRYGGSTPAGFDCSGLVQFSFRQAGVSLPRSTEDQLRTGNRVRISGVRRGDLLFFDEEGKKKSHVAIYLGDGRFVHAPSSGKRVRTDTLDSPYWRKHLSEARRI
jgi:murein DD-endopeptidase